MSEIKDLIQHALDQDYNKANEVFGQMMTIKTQDVLDQMSMKLAGQIYNGEEADEEDDVELASMSDEEIDAELEGIEGDVDDVDDVDVDVEEEDEET